MPTPCNTMFCGMFKLVPGAKGCSIKAAPLSTVTVACASWITA